VTDDEAFIRAIVDAPGDDAPRLVYADWLDERDDPRGAYMRAETEWAQPWRQGDRPPYSAHLLNLASPLESIWVARISRPPMGVCLDRFEIRDSGPHLALDDVKEFERRTQIDMPDALAAFLLNQNGGSLNRGLGIGLASIRIGSIRRLRPSKRETTTGKSVLLPQSNIQSLADPAWGKVIEFADDRTEGSFLIGVVSGVRGIIFHRGNRDARTQVTWAHNERIASSLSALFARLD
jgi:uncharacterized protein (TIGR02996 family)